MNNHADYNDCCNSISIGLQLSKYFLKKKQSKKWSFYSTDSRKEYVSSVVGGSNWFEEKRAFKSTENDWKITENKISSL